MPAGKIFEGIVYVLPTGCQWKALPKERFGRSSAIHTHFLRGAESGFLLTLWPAGLAEYDQMEAISWKWPSIDGAIVKAALAQETVGPNPTDREKKRKPAKFVSRRPWSPLVTPRKRSKSA
jgi:transposase